MDIWNQRIEFSLKGLCKFSLCKIRFASQSQKEAYDEAKEDFFVNKYKERGFGPWLSQRISGLMKKQGKGDRQTTNQEAEKHMACFGLSWVFCTAVNFTMKICLCELWCGGRAVKTICHVYSVAFKMSEEQF